jgi:hypothetical protein
MMIAKGKITKDEETIVIGTLYGQPITLKKSRKIDWKQYGLDELL